MKKVSVFDDVIETYDLLRDDGSVYERVLEKQNIFGITFNAGGMKGFFSLDKKCIPNLIDILVKIDKKGK